MKYDDRMDPECIELCDAINLIDGLTTTGSCCGHGRGSFDVYLQARSIRDLFVLGRAIDRRYAGPTPPWRIEAHITDLPEDPITLILCSGDNVGDKAYRQARTIERNIIELLRNERVGRMFGYKTVHEDGGGAALAIEEHGMRPSWCPDLDCIWVTGGVMPAALGRTSKVSEKDFNDSGMACGGRLPNPKPHGKTENTHRLCIRTLEGDIGAYLVNVSDCWYLELITNSLMEDARKPPSSTRKSTEKVKTG